MANAGSNGEYRISWWYEVPDVIPDQSRYSVSNGLLNFILASPHFYPEPYVMYAGQPRSREDGGYVWGERKSQDCIELAATSSMLPAILIIGDSTIAYSKVCDFLKQNIPMNGLPPASVFNFGTVAANSSMMLMQLLHHAVDKKPDAAVVLNGELDVITPLNFDPRPGNPHNHFLYDVIYAYFSSNYYSSNDASGCFSSTNVWPRGLDRPEHLTHAILDNILIERLTNLRAECNFRSPDWEQEIIEVYIRNVEKSIIPARTFGIRIMCALEPLLIFKEKLTDREKSALPGPEAMQYIERQYYLIGQRYDELSMKYRNDSGVIVLNMHDLFRKNEEEIFKDIIHYNDLGSEIISDAIRRRIALWLNPS